jgi:cyanuric acid amidohydrolase
MLQSEVYCVPMASPDDTSQLSALFDQGVIDPEHIVAIMAQTEGDPYNRGYCTLATQVLLSARLGMSHEEVFDRIPMLMIGGVGGIMCPHFNVFVKKPASDTGASGKRLSLGVASSRPLQPEEYGTMTQIELVAQTVEDAMRDAGITDPSEVECVEVKCPAMTPARVQDAQSRGAKVVNTNPVAASSFAKGACALGVALATGEIDRNQLNDGVINADKTLYSSIASTSAGSEQVACRVVVVGNVEGAPSRFFAAHGVMKDQLDIAGVQKMFGDAGLTMTDGVVAEKDRDRVAALFVNAGADFTPAVRDRRHVLHSDFLAPFAGIQAKAVAHAVVASVYGDTLFLASAGAEHQGPPGSNLICLIAEAEPTEA